MLLRDAEALGRIGAKGKGDGEMFENVSMTKLRDIAERAKAQVSRIRERSEAVLDGAFTVGEATGTAAVLGFVNGKYGKAGTGLGQHLEVAGVPVDLGVGTAVLALSALGGMSPKHEQHAYNVAAGALSAAGYRMAAEYAAKQAQPKTGYLPGGYGAGAGSHQYFRDYAGVPR